MTPETETPRPGLPTGNEASFQKVQSDSAITTVKIAVGNDVREQGTPVKNHEIQIGDLAERLTRHDRRADKMGKYFCAPMRDGARNADGALPWGLFCLDFDGKHDQPDPDVSKAFFAGIWHVGYSTHRYTPENGKHRVVLLLNREITADEHRRLFNALAEVLPFAPDDKLNHPDQPVFLPSCPPGSAPVAWFNDGEPFDVDAALAEHGRNADAESHASKAYKPAGDSVIAAFNAAHDLASILEQHGYRRRGRRYLHPNSESGIPSVSILKDGAICFSHSSSDPMGDGKAHDAFDAFRILDHGGDARAAVKTASAMLGMQGEQAKPKTRGKRTEATAVDEEDKDGKKKSQATLLIELADRFELFHDPDLNAYAVDTGEVRRVYAVRSKDFRNRLSGDFFTLTQKGCNGNAVSDALATIEAKAIHMGQRRPVYLRVARVDDCIYIDLADEQWRVVRVTSSGWEILDRSPVDFIRRAGMAAFPDPVPGGHIDRLRDFLNVEPDDFPLVVGWALGAYRAHGEYPILVLQGEEGSGKSTAGRVLRALTDPSTVPLRSPPKTIDDLLVSATGNHVVALDNLSGITSEIADALCRLSTGGGMDKRKLFTDNDQVLIDLTRPIIVNGIDEIATRSDLASRSIIVRLPTITSQLTSEEAFRREFSTALPGIFGALLSGVSASLTRGYFKVEKRVRMVDFVRWVSQAEPAFGWVQGTFLDRFVNMRKRSVEDGIEASPVGSCLVEYMRNREPNMHWSPKPTHLLDELTNIAGSRAKSKAWPQSTRGLLNTLIRLAPSLRAVGITFTKDENHDRLYHIHNAGKETPQAPQAPHPSNDAGLSGADSGAHRSAPDMGDTPQAPAMRPEPKPSNDGGSSDIRGARGVSGANFPNKTLLPDGLDGQTTMTAKQFMEGDRL